MRTRYIPSASFNAGNTKKFKLRKQIYYCKRNYMMVGDIAPYYYVSDIGGVVKYNPRYDAMEPIDIRSDMYVVVYNKGGSKKYSYMRLDYLVALAWKWNREGHDKVLHKNGNMMDCRVDNLSWCDSLKEVKESARKWRIIAQMPNKLANQGDNQTIQSFRTLKEASVALKMKIRDVLYHAITERESDDGTKLRFALSEWEVRK